MTAWCLFEQSGTFKNEFLKLGFENAFDCDIANAEPKAVEHKQHDIIYKDDKLKFWDWHNFN